MKTTNCDCGHTVSVEDTDCTTGYGIDADNKKICFACCAINDAKSMRETGKATLYYHGGQVTNWPGTLKLPVLAVKYSRNNWGSKRTDFWFDFEGVRWHGVQVGENSELARCHARKFRGQPMLMANL